MTNEAACFLAQSLGGGGPEEKHAANFTQTTDVQQEITSLLKSDRINLCSFYRLCLKQTLRFMSVIFKH